MKRLLLSTLCSLLSVLAFAQGWPEQYGGVMLQGFYWDSFSDSRWKVLESQADVLKDYFSLVWVPQSGNCGGGQSMGYDDLYWFNNYNSSFGTEQELRSMIRTFRDKGIGTIADVVINHRKDIRDWVVFPEETYKGQTYQLLPSDVCANDDGNRTRTEAAKLGYTLSTNIDTGEDWNGFRDLDHNSANVQRNVHAYLDFLLNDLGYGGFRYDMVKGYAGRFTGIYNSTAKPKFSVGEYWDGNVSVVQNWLNNTKVDDKIQSAAFDFPFRYTVRDAANNGDWTKLASTATLAAKSDYRRYSVTFVENHDTEFRSANEQQDPLRKDTLAANAYLLAMPGTPCVFYKHWIACKRDIAKMIRVRQLIGIHNQSTTTQYESKAGHYAHIANGTNGSLLCVVGKDAASFNATSRWHLAASGYHWAYYTDKGIEVQDIDFPEEQFTPYTITVGVNVDNVGWSNVNFWTWGGDGTHGTATGKWPGDRVTTTQTLGGKTFYVRTYTISSVRDCVSFVFSTGTGSPQTVDIPNVTETSWFSVSTAKEGDKYKVDDITNAVSVDEVKADTRSGHIYTIDGRRTSRAGKGLYIINGKKVVL